MGEEELHSVNRLSLGEAHWLSTSLHIGALPCRLFIPHPSLVQVKLLILVVIFLDGTAHLFEVCDKFGRCQVICLLGRIVGKVVSEGNLEWIRQIVNVRYLDDLYLE